MTIIRTLLAAIACVSLLACQTTKKECPMSKQQCEMKNGKCPAKKHSH